MSVEITTAARRLTRQHNSDKVASGHIYLVNLLTGDIGEWVSGYACKQIDEASPLFGRYAVLRISYGRITQKQSQEFINAKGIGSW